MTHNFEQDSYAATEIFARLITEECIPSETDVSWVLNLAKQKLSDQPLGDEGELVRNFLDAGVTPETIARYTKLQVYGAIFRLIYRLEDSGEHLGEDHAWNMAIFRNFGHYVCEMDPGHELLLGLDPCGREYRRPGVPSS